MEENELKALLALILMVALPISVQLYFTLKGRSMETV